MGWAWLSLLCTFFGDGLGAFVPENLVRICNSRSINHTRAGQALIPLGRKKTKHGNPKPGTLDMCDSIVIALAGEKLVREAQTT